MAAVISLISLAVGSYDASHHHDPPVAGLADVAINETEQGGSLLISGLQVPIFFYGIETLTNGISLARYEDPANVRAPAFRTYKLKDNFGAIDLGPDFGVLVKIHVVSVTPGHFGALAKIRYRVTYYGENGQPDLPR